MAADNWRASYQTDSGNDLLRQRRMQDQKMMADMLKMINAATPQTMLGYGLGKLLRGAWDHRKRKADENNNSDLFGNKNTQVNSSNGAFTIGGIDPRTATVDESKPAYYGIAPTKGLLGNRMLGDFMTNNPNNVIALGQQQTKQEVTQPNGQKESVTTTSPYTISGGNIPFAQQVQQAADNIGAGLTWEDILKNANYYGR